jgi:superfamily II DNA or RNA helicase
MHQSFDLEKLRRDNPEYKGKIPFEHQKDAFAKLSKLFLFNDNEHKSGILVLPTGAGKTFTSVNWICRNVLPKNIKVLWLAHTSHLLEQAYKTFEDNLLEIHDRKRINIRVVSSNPVHSNASDIQLTDDIVIVTTQTAISNWQSKALDGKGNKRVTNFEEYIKYSKKDRTISGFG